MLCETSKDGQGPALLPTNTTDWVNNQTDPKSAKVSSYVSTNLMSPLALIRSQPGGAEEPNGAESGFSSCAAALYFICYLIRNM